MRFSVHIQKLSLSLGSVIGEDIIEIDFSHSKANLKVYPNGLKVYDSFKLIEYFPLSNTPCLGPINQVFFSELPID